VPHHGLWEIQIPAEQEVAKKSQSVIQVKEIRLRPKTEEHDLQTKVKHIQKFLGQNDKVKVTMMFRGREIAYTEIGMKIMETLLSSLADVCTVDQRPKMEGRSMVMILLPKK
jgi:translation initiation factor IF-3